MSHSHPLINHRENRLAYYAALFDREGTIGMRPQRNTYLFRLRVETADYEMLSRLCCILGYGSVRPGPKRKNRLPTWVCQTAAQDAVLDTLTRLHPHIHTKRSQVDLVLDCLSEPDRPLIELQRYFVELWKLKLRKPQLSRNQHGACSLHIETLRQLHPRWFD